jgi:tight adherence protein B
VTLGASELRWLAVVAGGGGAACWAVLFLVGRLSSARHGLLRYEQALHRDLSFLRVPISARQVLAAQGALCLASGCVSLTLPPLLASLTLLPVVCVAPVLQTRRAHRIAALEEQLDGWLMGLASVLRATPSLGEAIEFSLGLVVSPLRDELETLVKEQKLGTPLEEALHRLGDRVGSQTVKSALGTLRIGRRTGGDISAILERSAGTLREMARLEGVVRVKTAEGKAQAYVLGFLPFPLVALFHQVNPDFLRPLIEQSRGQWVGLCALLVWGVAVALTRRFLRVDL